jgi:RNA polymerase sigma-70 factor (ECF subfamily)
MTGSVFDAEDVLQDALMRALPAFEVGSNVADLERWMFRIVHNAAIDFLRRKAREDSLRSDYDPELLEDNDKLDERIEAVSVSMATLMRLPATQRAVVVLKDVMGYRLQDVTFILQLSLPAVKSALHRGRAQLKDIAAHPATIAPLPSKMSDVQRALFEKYVDRFNAHDFDSIRDALAEEVRLDLVGVERRDGKQRVAGYFENYAKKPDWRLRVGVLEGRLVVFVHGIEAQSLPQYVILLDWEGTELHRIRDFRYARYILENAEIPESFPEPLSSLVHESHDSSLQGGS